MKKIRVKIVVVDCDMARYFSFSWKENSYQINNDQVNREGYFLCLHDDLVKPFKYSGQCKDNLIFNYSIEVNVDGKLISRLDLRSQRFHMDNPTATIVKRSSEYMSINKIMSLRNVVNEYANMTKKQASLIKSELRLQLVIVTWVKVQFF